ncbi:MAG: peptidylprolyl isomerase [Bacteroidales bacterium]
MSIARNKMVTLSYTLKNGNAGGDLIESTKDQAPLQFIYGSGRMLEQFENKLEGLTSGDDFEFVLAPSEAYGDRNEENVVEIPRDVFMEDGKFNTDLIYVGNFVPMMTQDGQQMTGKVLDVGNNEVTMDFNHPLSGMDLHFSGNVIEVRDATDEEIVALTSHGGGCSSGSCEGCSC